MYVCGVTVYDYSHLGHARTIVVFDVLRRLLKKKGFKLKHVQNFTDVDDKIIRKAKEMGLTVEEVSSRFIEAYFKDFDALNIERVESYPKATEFISVMHEMIKGLMDKGYAYRTKTGIYFNVPKFKEYGKLSKINPEELKAGARVEVDPTKKNPLDFALWKFYEEEPKYSSPWGYGRPGWHIECSSMVWKIFGDTIDIHGGGEDLIFPHHENEIAQSEAFTGKPLARIWVHVGLLKIGEEKMSKSLGNIVPLKDAIPIWGPNTIRYFLLMSHYRSQVRLSDRALKNAADNWRIIEGAAYDLVQPYGEEGDVSLVEEAERCFEKFDEALSDDLNTPMALMELVKLSKSVSRAQARRKLNESVAGEVKMIFDQMFYIMGFKLPNVSEEERRYIQEMVEKRAELRRKRRYSEADRIRDELRKMKVLLIDVGERTFWRKVEHLP